MNESNISSSGDRLGELPDSLIFHIFWCLRIRDVVRTTVLSKRWRNLWTTSPFLNFTDNDPHVYRVKGALEKVRNLFNRALLLWRGTKLLKFKVMIRRQLSMSLVDDINVWVRFATEKKVRELYLDLHYPIVTHVIEAEFESLWSCSSLEVLSMKGCTFSIGNGNVKWDRLKSLTIHTSYFREDLFSKVLCGSPNLEVFILSHSERGGNCYIQSSSLKKLSIKKNFYSDKRWKNTEMKIQTPNLEMLEISGAPCTKFLVEVGCLTGVTLGLLCLEQCTTSGEADSLQETLKKILPTIQHVESVTLSECCLEVLGDMNRKSPLPPLSKVKFLKLNASNHTQSFSKHEQIAGLLQIFPELKSLVIEDKYEDEEECEDDDKDGYQDDRESLEFEANFPSSFLLQLRTVEVTWGECDKSIFSFIETLLKYATKLEKMVFQVNKWTPLPSLPNSSPSYSLFLASRKLLRMPRSSPTAQLIFCEN